MAEREGFTPAELELGSRLYGTDNMLPWLRSILAQAVDALKQNHLSSHEIRHLLVMHEGVVEEAIQSCKALSEEKVCMLSLPVLYFLKFVCNWYFQEYFASSILCPYR